MEMTDQGLSGQVLGARLADGIAQQATLQLLGDFYGLINRLHGNSTKKPHYLIYGSAAILK